MINCKALVIVIQLILMIHLQFSKAEDYCTLDCQSDHTICKYPKDEPAAKCNSVQRGLNEEQKKQIVDLHNKLRHKVASGNEPRGNPGPQPATKTKTMSIMKWDNELATVAQRWADQCHFDHDSCRMVRRFLVGQNLAFKGSNMESKIFSLEEMIMLWYEEVADQSRHNLDPFKFQHNTGHYTQLVWGNSTLIGCGALRYKEEEFYKYFLVCNYGPSGNIIGQPIYDFRVTSDLPQESSADLGKNIPQVLILVFSALAIAFFK